MTLSRLAPAVAALLVGSVTAANATEIAITNAGFEDVAFADGTSNFATSGTTAIAGWLITGFAGGGGGTANPGPHETAFPTGVPEGNNMAYAEAATVSQTLSATLAPGIYTLSMMVGNPADRSDVADPASFDVYLPDTNRVIASSTAIALGQIGNGNFVSFVASGTVLPADADIGRTLGIRLHTGLPISTTSPYFAFDNVHLDLAPVPEPTTWALMALGLVAIGRRIGTRGRDKRLDWRA